MNTKIILFFNNHSSYKDLVKNYLEIENIPFQDFTSIKNLKTDKTALLNKENYLVICDYHVEMEKDVMFIFKNFKLLMIIPSSLNLDKKDFMNPKVKYLKSPFLKEDLLNILKK